MADPVDLEMETRQDLTFKSQYDFNRPALTECIDCDEPIPEARQKLGGVTRCIECQSLEDRKR